MAQKYRPLFKLDTGGMAEVYVAEAEALAGFKKRVAIKRILPGLLKEDRFVRMFLDEARLSLNLSHANIVSVFDIGKSDNTYFIVMEYVEGTNLKAILEYLTGHGRRLPVALSIWILNEILKGLDYAHNLRDDQGREIGIVHRDISPPNILISWNGEVKLTDFGLAKATTQLENTDPGVVKGKFAYLSPEAAHGLAVDRRTDVFAVGIMAWEMLTGRRLFLGETDWQTIEAVRAANVPSIRAVNPEVPAEIEAIVAKALARDTQERYQDCTEFADDLLGVLFSYGLKVSARDMSALLVELREAKARAKQAEGSVGGTNLILELLAEEMTNFQSIGEDEEDTASTPISDGGGAFDASAPLDIDFAGASQTPPPASDPQPNQRKRAATLMYGAGVAPIAAPRAAGAASAPVPAPIGNRRAASAPAPVSAPSPAPAAPPSVPSAAPSGPSFAAPSGPSFAAPLPGGTNPAEAQAMLLARARMPSPAPKAEPGGGLRVVLIVLVVLLLLGGAGAAVFFFVLEGKLPF
jgi:serine/threonine protein kinase